MSTDVKATLSQTESLATTRRRFLAVSTAAGLGGTLLPGALLALASSSGEAQSPAQSDLRGWPAITPEMVDAAATIAAIKLTAEQKQMMLEGLVGQRNSALRVRGMHLPNSIAPTAVFNPVPAGTAAPQPASRRPVVLGPVPSIADISPSQEDKLAFATIRQLGELLRKRQITSLDLTKLYLARLKRYDPTLHFVITFTEERALTQAAAADKELAEGKDRGPLHGIPWGAKDLLAVKGYPTTWGAAGFENQTFDEDAEVVKRLDAAGAVLVAKLTMGALAQGDLWGYAAGTGKPGARTRNPWNPKQGSSGSSAGSASATSAGCVGFALGTETLGSILFTQHTLRRHGPAPELWSRPAHRCDGPRLVDGQDRPHYALGRRLRPRPQRPLRSGWPRPERAARAVPCRPHHRHPPATRRLHRVRLQGSQAPAPVGR